MLGFHSQSFLNHTCPTSYLSFSSVGSPFGVSFKQAVVELFDDQVDAVSMLHLLSILNYLLNMAQAPRGKKSPKISKKLQNGEHLNVQAESNLAERSLC